MTDAESSTHQLTAFIAEWVIRDNCANIQGEPKACSDRMYEAIKTAFPKASKAEVDAAVGVIIDEIDRLPRDQPPADATRTAKEAWVRVPGKHRTQEAAWEVALAMLETRH